jgi:hypothetical protein
MIGASVTRLHAEIGMSAIFMVAETAVTGGPHFTIVMACAPLGLARSVEFDSEADLRIR